MSTKSAVGMAFSRAVGKIKLQANQNSPHILFGVGLVGVGAGIVLACRSTLKLETTLDEAREGIDSAKANRDPESLDYRKAVVLAHAEGAVSIIKLYGPATIATTVGVVCLTGSHIQLSQRNAALTTAYAALHQTYSDYRSRVRAELGEEKEFELAHDLRTEMITEGGKKIKRYSGDPRSISIYARFFDEACPDWQPDPEFNKIFLSVNQSYFNDILHSRGYVFLNEVYARLGIPASRAGQFVGWHIDSDGDSYVDFGMHDVRNTEFINGREGSILLDFNVNGPIVDLFRDEPPCELDR